MVKVVTILICLVTPVDHVDALFGQTLILIETNDVVSDHEETRKQQLRKVTDDSIDLVLCAEAVATSTYHLNCFQSFCSVTLVPFHSCDDSNWVRWNHLVESAKSSPQEQRQVEEVSKQHRSVSAN